ncbi:histidine kinase [Aestuariivirga litoralis]|uniref:histidine kinase n=1 Tax=Aestuariivirga litoralis TaxID=2650924 RepID=A0A2W2ALQ7_9HYPH|nr:stimulus-sensing domain-containing protein [Aestuariivirga litoralis]PZF76485.1 histidine kinase [Aestuariivirga litoralis]
MLDKVMPPETADRAEAEDADAAEREAAPRQGLVRRIWPHRLTSRIVLLNLLGLIVLVSGILYFNQFRQGLIDARVQSLTTQAQIIAAAVAGSATVDTGSIVIDPDSLADSNEELLPDTEQMSSLDFPIDPEAAGPVLKRLLANTTVRARIIDKDGNLVVDSRFLYSRGDIVQTDLPPPNGEQDSMRSLWNRFVTWTFSYDYPKQIEYGIDNGKDFPEVAAALKGAKVSLVRLNDRGQIIVVVAVPIQRFRAVLGSLVLSTTGGEIDNVLRAERQVVLMTFGFVALVTILLSILLASTIALPLRKLAAAAERVRRGINKRVEIPDFSARGDEIGDLSGAVRDMTNALYNRIAAIEAFAADVSHELKNPLTSLRSAVETLAYAKTPEQRERLVEIVNHDVKRLDRLITDISDASRLDAELARGEAQAFDLSQLLESITSFANDTRKEAQAEVEFEIAKPPPGMDRARAYTVMGHDSRLGQVVRNLIDNARSFTRPGTKLQVRVRRVGPDVEFRVDDFGPGIPPDNLERVFERFYTDRPEGSFGSNSGLGLSISQQIVDAHKGRIWAENRLGKPDESGEKPILGARFTVRIPAATNA